MRLQLTWLAKQPHATHAGSESGYGEKGYAFERFRFGARDRPGGMPEKLPEGLPEGLPEELPGELGMNGQIQYRPGPPSDFPCISALQHHVSAATGGFVSVFIPFIASCLIVHFSRMIISLKNMYCKFDGKFFQKFGGIQWPIISKWQKCFGIKYTMKY